MLEEHPPLNLDCQNVNDIGWIDSENIVISARQNLSRGVGGMGVFKIKGFAAGALCFNSGSSKVIASCEETSNGGIGVWIRWLNGSNCLFDNSCINYHVASIFWISETKLFCSMDDKIYLYCDALYHWVLTSNLETCQGGSIRDFSIVVLGFLLLGSRRMYSIMRETPSAPII
ncbi:hypothetical protein MKX01_021397 [Papaver californicum]|nr:hypothetical protein MKX01_021397 [Papaver californicum]